MSTDITVRTVEATTQPLPSRPAELPLEEVLEYVRRDSRQHAEIYLKQCEVPHGGE